MTISIHVPRVEDDSRCAKTFICAYWISIHVPRVEDDSDVLGRFFIHTISIHVPRVEDDFM